MHGQPYDHRQQLPPGFPRPQGPDFVEPGRKVSRRARRRVHARDRRVRRHRKDLPAQYYGW